MEKIHFLDREETKEKKQPSVGERPQRQKKGGHSPWKAAPFQTSDDFLIT
jgi:hypothetical protein